MKRFAPPILLFLSAIPLLLELPYCFQAMKSSPPENWNWCFLFGAVALFIVLLPHLRKACSSCEFSFQRLLFVLPALLLLAGGVFRHIHFLVLVSGILLLLSMALSLFGGQVALYLLPVAGMLLLFLPNTGFLLATVFPWNALPLKICAALFFIALVPLVLSWKARLLSPSTFLFTTIAILIVAGYFVSTNPPALEQPLLPDFTPLLTQNFRGITDTVTEGDFQFFGKSKIDRFLYYRKDDDTSVSVLTVGEIDNIHQVHPVVFCLRAGGYRTLSEQSIRWPEESAQPWNIREILAQRNEQKVLFWQWFSTAEKSTASFLLFRSLYSSADNWTVFLIGTPVRDSYEQSHKVLGQFVKDFLSVP